MTGIGYVNYPQMLEAIKAVQPKANSSGGGGGGGGGANGSSGSGSGVIVVVIAVAVLLCVLAVAGVVSYKRYQWRQTQSQQSGLNGPLIQQTEMEMASMSEQPGKFVRPHSHAEYVPPNPLP
jgi:hypothetical protein